MPYWSRNGQTIKVCAFDAQTNDFSESGALCSRAARVEDCGCGQDLRWCAFGGEHRAVNRGMRMALNRFIGSVFERDEPYSALFTSRRAFVNGAVSYFWKHHTGAPAGLVFEPAPLDADLLPDIPFTANDDWHEVELPNQHAGFLTRPAFLLRFQTNRARPIGFMTRFCANLQSARWRFTRGGR